MIEFSLREGLTKEKGFEIVELLNKKSRLV